MKKVVNGKVYNTETAEEVAYWSNNYGCTDFKHCEESLYKTPKGAWFLSGKGGPSSKYAYSVGNGWSGGSGLEPITADEARAWLESKDFVAELEEHFADQIEEA